MKRKSAAGSPHVAHCTIALETLGKERDCSQSVTELIYARNGDFDM